MSHEGGRPLAERHANLGGCLGRQKRWDDSIGAMRKAIDLRLEVSHGPSRYLPADRSLAWIIYIRKWSGLQGNDSHDPWPLEADEKTQEHVAGEANALATALKTQGFNPPPDIEAFWRPQQKLSGAEARTQVRRPAGTRLVCRRTHPRIATNCARTAGGV